MYKHILITTDGSELAQQGVTHGLSLAAATGAKVTLITVTPPFPIVTGMMGETAYLSSETLADYDAAQVRSAAEALAAAAALAPAGLAIDTCHVPDSQPAEAILKQADELGCDLICMASHGRRGLRRLLLGSQAAEVVAHASIPVLVVR